MDIDAELERLSREARRKLEAERGPFDAPAHDQGADALLGARRGAARPRGAASLGSKVAVVVVGLFAALVAWRLVIAPLIRLALLLALVAAVVWLVIRLTGDDEAGEEVRAP